ncbi:helix-turn-helix domain-containing protein [Glycomyces sp. A-F 0318]|uniref:helix-turn-helix domain-containing protein n=1 Tax=Glycomyces amatae TaxID=2881355 RepID=UPI001E4B577B|nr:helix-turn-helix transcriptional regulator [Glycomyces amatae]MCD0444803.1 helix-turn-helix domain-containing protein [Glycomyces amatae]
MSRGGGYDLPTEEVAMPKMTGPTIPRWQLGEALEGLRRKTKKSRDEIAELMDCSESKIRKIEEGRIGISRIELLYLLDLLGVKDEENRTALVELAKKGKERGYWASFGSVPTAFENLLGIEGAATTIRFFESMMVDGMLQTEKYAWALIESTWHSGQTPVENQVEMRMERQRRLLDEDPPEIWAIFDEAVLRRNIGGPEIMHEQLLHLLEFGKRPYVNIQIVPLSHGGYHGLLGPVKLLEFPEDFHSPVAYAETQAGSFYLEKESEVQRCSVAYSHMMAAALSQQESAKLIRAVAKELG